jgi:hypothetical protein
MNKDLIKNRLEQDTNTTFRMTGVGDVIEFYNSENPLVVLLVDFESREATISCRPIDAASTAIEYDTTNENEMFNVFNFIYTVTLTQREAIRNMFAL